MNWSAQNRRLAAVGADRTTGTAIARSPSIAAAPPVRHFTQIESRSPDSPLRAALDDIPSTTLRGPTSHGRFMLAAALDERRRIRVRRLLRRLDWSCDEPLLLRVEAEAVTLTPMRLHARGASLPVGEHQIKMAGGRLLLPAWVCYRLGVAPGETVLLVPRRSSSGVSQLQVTAGRGWSVLGESSALNGGIGP